MEPASITVGLDGSPESLEAALWASDEADRRGLGLRLLHAWVLLAGEPSTGLPADQDQNYWAKRIVRAAVAAVHERHHDLAVIEDLVAEEPETALLRAAESSTMVVLGSRGLERVESFFLGDISLQVAGRAERPVVLVRSAAAGARPPVGTDEGGVVVGVSLHGPCDSMLEFAFETAAARGVPLLVVHGCPLPVQAYAPWGVDPDVAGEISKEAGEKLSQAVQPWRERNLDVRVTTTVRLGSPARAALGAAEGAGLLVVGRRRHHQPLAPRLGNVAQACVHHARCPVAVVPHN
ncbi:stress-inducible protein [Streptomyces albireticuli]|uniref:Stress-inducible protein n=1 Tax=Streptomyces albireticuli TaxID=1940 RepID=A0A1Z2KXG3_9ACTN|nr:universal stress protein [Streptomyces albireticuli]ARZ66728.1 stress-inducible protein [Streptomyces albireticuli]